MIAQARRVIGYGGAFPPHEGLRKKFLEARNFEEAFALRLVRQAASVRDHEALAEIALAMGAHVVTSERR